MGINKAKDATKKNKTSDFAIKKTPFKRISRNLANTAYNLRLIADNKQRFKIEDDAYNLIQFFTESKLIDIAKYACLQTKIDNKATTTALHYKLGSLLEQKKDPSKWTIEDMYDLLLAKENTIYSDKLNPTVNKQLLNCTDCRKKLTVNKVVAQIRELEKKKQKVREFCEDVKRNKAGKRQSAILSGLTAESKLLGVENILDEAQYIKFSNDLYNEQLKLKNSIDK